MSIVKQAFREAFAPPDRSPPWAWAEKNVAVDPTSPYQGLWNSELSPWVREVMEVFADNEIEQLSLMTSAQSAKTQTMICLLVWALTQEPAPTMWVTSTGDEASYFMRTRLEPTIQSCSPLYRSLIRGSSAINKMEVMFESASLILTGASSPSRLQSKPVRWLFLDEVRNYPDGALEMVQKRTRAYWNARTCIVSTPDTEDDAMHRTYMEGDQRVWHYQCSSCEEFVGLRWGDLKWDSNKDDQGRYDFDELEKTIRLECPLCQNTVFDTPQDRRRIAHEGKFIATNPTAPSSKASFHWNALLPPWVRWKDLVQEFLSAKRALSNGNPSPMKDFINESAGEPWREVMKSIDDNSIDDRRGDYKMREEWGEEFTRFMAVDVQGAGGLHYWYVIRSFAKEGACSRLVSFGKVHSETDLLALAEENDIPPARCLIDCGWNTASVLKFCQVHNWKPFRGDGAKFFRVKHKKSGKSVRQIWTETWADAQMGTRLQGKQKMVKRYVWSNESVKNIMAELMAGQLGSWTIARNTPVEYIKQVTAEIRQEKIGAKGDITHQWKQIRRDNHLFDCELMILVASLATRALGYDAEPIDETDSAEDETGK